MVTQKFPFLCQMPCSKLRNVEESTPSVEIEPARSPRLIEEGEPQSLHPAIRRVWQFSALFSGLTFAVILGLPEFFIVRNLDTWPIRFPVIGPAFAFATTGLSWFLAGRQYRNWSYALRASDLVLSYGLLWRTRRCVARSRVQHVDINSGPLDRRFGLVQVSIYAAGGLGGVGSIPGLTPERAEELRAALLDGRAADA